MSRTTLLVDRTLIPRLRAKLKAINDGKAGGDRKVTMMDITNQLVSMYVEGKISVTIPERRV